MKLHDLHPAPAHGVPGRRGIAAGKGKTAGRGTKGQKARAGGSIPPWFEGGQTPLHMRDSEAPGLQEPRSRSTTRSSTSALSPCSPSAAPSRAASRRAQGCVCQGRPPHPSTRTCSGRRPVRTLKKPLQILGSGELVTALCRRRRVHEVGGGRDRGGGCTRFRPRSPTTRSASATGAKDDSAQDRRGVGRRPAEQPPIGRSTPGCSGRRPSPTAAQSEAASERALDGEDRGGRPSSLTKGDLGGASDAGARSSTKSPDATVTPTRLTSAGAGRRVRTPPRPPT